MGTAVASLLRPLFIAGSREARSMLVLGSEAKGAGRPPAIVSHPTHRSHPTAGLASNALWTHLRNRILTSASPAVRDNCKHSQMSEGEK